MWRITKGIFGAKKGTKGVFAVDTVTGGVFLSMSRAKKKQDNAVLRGKKLRFLRETFGFTRAALVSDTKWVELNGAGVALTREDNLGKLERGVRCLTDEHLVKISLAFQVPLDVLFDECSYERFVEEAGPLCERMKSGLVPGIPSLPERDGEMMLSTGYYRKISYYAGRWVKEGMEFDLIELFGVEVRRFTTTDRLIDESLLDETGRAFLFMASLQYGASWRRWCEANRKNEVALQGLFKALETKKWRVRFRVLYSLQHMDRKLLEGTLKKGNHDRLSERTIAVIEDHVLSGRVVSFLREIAENKNHILSVKAREVLIEIAEKWRDPDVNMDFPL